MAARIPPDVEVRVELEEGITIGGAPESFLDSLPEFEVNQLPPSPALFRSKSYSPEHRVIRPKKETAVGKSWWLDKSREELNKEAAVRVPEMRAKKEAGYVPGTSRHADDLKSSRRSSRKDSDA